MAILRSTRANCNDDDTVSADKRKTIKDIRFESLKTCAALKDADEPKKVVLEDGLDLLGSAQVGGAGSSTGAAPCAIVPLATPLQATIPKGKGKKGKGKGKDKTDRDHQKDSLLAMVGQAKKATF